MTSWMVRANSCTFVSEGAVKAGRAIGIFGFAAPTMRMIGTAGIGGSGGGAPLAAGPGSRAAPRSVAAKARGAESHTIRRTILTASPSRGPASVFRQDDLDGKGQGRIGQARREGRKHRVVHRLQDRAVHGIV